MVDKLIGSSASGLKPGLEKLRAQVRVAAAKPDPQRPGVTLEDLQKTGMTMHRLQAGECVIGAKLGMTSKVKRDALGIGEPVYGRLTSGMIHPFGEPLRLDELIHPSVEPEIPLTESSPAALFHASSDSIQ